MNLAAALLAPLLLLFPSASVPASGDDDAGDGDGGATLAGQGPQTEAPEWPVGPLPPYLPDVAGQVRIEQRMTIRITPGAMMPMPPDMLAALQGRAIETRFKERKIGKCLPISAIVGVRPSGDSDLILFTRDRRMVTAELERTCHARDFYSGFYLERNSDGMVCVDRDTLLSRSGTNCKLSRIRQLVPADD
jgi:hypothetical protein